MRDKLTAAHLATRDAPLLSRRHVVEACHRQIERHGYPRLVMTLLMVLTAGAGWLASSVLLASGMETMWVRYPVALAIAYGAFLFLLWLWLRRGHLDVPDVHVDGGGRSGEAGRLSSSNLEGHGGQFGGGGASGSFDDGPAGGTDVPGATAGDLAAGDVLGAVDEVAVPLVAIVAAVALALGVAFASIYVVYTAPSLLAEITVDAALSYTLVRRLKHGQRRLWLGTAIARTWGPALCTAAFVAAVGAALSVWAPGTTSLGAALRHLLGG